METDRIIIMPVYSDTVIKDFFPAELLKLLKGKSCFHIKKLDATLEKQIQDAIKKGYTHFIAKISAAVYIITPIIIWFMSDTSPGDIIGGLFSLGMGVLMLYIGFFRKYP